jgi:hypothetical protein
MLSIKFGWSLQQEIIIIWPWSFQQEIIIIWPWSFQQEILIRFKEILPIALTPLIIKWHVGMLSIKFDDRNIYKKKKWRKHIPSLTLNGRPLNIKSYFITTDRYTYRLQYIHIVTTNIKKQRNKQKQKRANKEQKTNVRWNSSKTKLIKSLM